MLHLDLVWLQEMKTIDLVLLVVYGIHLIVAFAYLIPDIGAAIAEQCQNNWNCARQIRHSRTPFVDYGVDLADGQWREFRGAIWILSIAAAITCTLSYLLRQYLKGSTEHTYLYYNSHLRLAVGVVILVVQHGYHSMIIIAIALLGFGLTKLPLKSWQPAVAWGYAILILLFKETYRIQHLPQFQFLSILFNRRFGGMYGWQMPANFLVLRIISYSLDEYWAGTRKDSHKRESTDSTAARQVSSRQDASSEESLPLGLYKLHHFMAYTLYAPLYLAGPIITYNGFLRSLITSQAAPHQEIHTTASSPAQKKDNVWLYMARWVGCLALMEFLLNRYPFFAVVHSGLLKHLTPAQTAVVSYMLLKLMWLKFLLLWRFFRLWALLDGVDAPENMTRCMSNNHSLEGFWRGWHSSFNKFLVRYLYRPLGGKTNQLFSAWVIFIFVALWHDMEWKLFAWGALNAFFYAVEVTFKRLVKRAGILESMPSYLSDLLCALCGACYIMVLISVNLVGYAVGVGGVSAILAKISSPEGLQTGAVCFYYLTIGVLIMQFMQRVGWTRAA